MEPRDELRAADADREVVAERLRLAVDEGRLSLYEYDERLRQAYQARTYGELDRLLADLPGPRLAAASQLARVDQPEVGVPQPGAVRAWLAAQWGPWARVVAICVGIWAVISLLSGSPIYFWPGWVAGPWGVVLLVQTVTGLASGEPQKWAQRRARRRARKAERAAGGGPAGTTDPAPDR